MTDGTGDELRVVSRFVREQRRYTKDELQKLFLYDEQGVEQFIRSLKSYNVLKAVKNNADQRELTDLVDEDIEVADETADEAQYLYVFTYVGVITIGRRVIKAYPKYLLSAVEPLAEMKQVLRVLERYSNAEKQIISLYNGDGEHKSFNLLAVMLFLLRDYHECGIYSNSEDVLEINGEGAVAWQRTIDEGFVFIRGNRPYYVELYTERTVEDNMDYFRRLHECVLTDISNQLREAQLENLFDMVPVELSDADIDEFGDREYILSRLQAELHIQFNTRKQILLKTLYVYLAQHRKMREQEEGLSMFGTTAFHMVWERVCAVVFGDKRNVPLGSLAMKAPLAAVYEPSARLTDIIDRPRWIGNDTEEEAKDTLTPDIIVLEDRDGADVFYILDAKYYNLQLERGKKLRGAPGVGDITKQYLYQLAFQDFLRAHSIKAVKNCFLMPAEKDEVIDMGIVKLGMMERLGLENIQVRLLPAGKIYDCYIAGRGMSVGELKL